MNSLLHFTLLVSICINIVLLSKQMERDMKKRKRKFRKRTAKYTPKAVVMEQTAVTPQKTSTTASQEEVAAEEVAWEHPRVRKATAADTAEWELLGMSLQGKGHVEGDIPCQDYHHIEVLDAEKGLGVVVVSDGAGSKANSEHGSKLVCLQTIHHLKQAIKTLAWHDDNNPDLATWNGVSRTIVQLLQNDLFDHARQSDCPFDSLGATWMMLFFTPRKSYFAHIGDGRAGVLTDDGWKAILTPHKGEEANQTVFVTNRVLDEGLKVSGVNVPETLVIEEAIHSFVLMSDGCEDGLWVKNRKESLPDGDYRYVPLNTPFSLALDDIMARMKACEKAQQRELLFNIMDHYNKPLKNEIDDKTVCLGYKR